MPPMTELKNGDEVEIIRSKAQVPPAALGAGGGHRQGARRHSPRHQERHPQAIFGPRHTHPQERAFERSGKTFEKDKAKVLHRSARDVDDVMAAVGRGELSSIDVMRAVYPDFKEERIGPPAPKPREEGWFNLRNAAGMLFKLPGRSQKRQVVEATRSQAVMDGAVPIRGTRGDLPVKFAPEGAVPGDRIVGIVQPAPASRSIRSSHPR